MENIKMNEEIENININKKPNFYFLISIVLISFSIIISTYLYIMNNNILKNIENLNTKVETYNKEINELKNNKLIIAYNTVKSSIFDINNNIKKSEVYNYINEFTNLNNKYKLNFT
jgi:predicted PurR-regulated permease PerM